jgi:hypothetical protein
LVRSKAWKTVKDILRRAEKRPENILEDDEGLGE